MNRISFLDTHVYPGCMAIFFFRITPGNTTASAIVEFSDGAIANGEVAYLDSDELSIIVDSYTTASGTSIAKKSWHLRYDNNQDIWKVTGKM